MTWGKKDLQQSLSKIISESKKGPRYREAPFEKIISADIRYKPDDYWPPGKTVIHLVGAPQESADHIFEILSKKFEMPETTLRWWKQTAPAHDSSGGLTTGNWEKYVPGEGFSKTLQRQDNSVCNIIILYHHDGHDPFPILSEAFDKDVVSLTTSYLILPLCERILDFWSSFNVIASKEAPLLEVNTEGTSFLQPTTYFAPLTVKHLELVPTAQLRISGTAIRKLGCLQRPTS